MTTVSMALIVTLACVIGWFIFKNMLLRAELRGSYTSSARQSQSIHSFHADPSMNTSSNIGLFFFVLLIVIFFGYIAISMAWWA